MSERKRLTSKYLYSQPITTGKLRQIIGAFQGEALKAGKGPRVLNKLIENIVELKIDVDWPYVLGDLTETGKERAVDNMFRELLAGDVMKPADVESPNPLEDPMDVDDPKPQEDELLPEFSSVLQTPAELYSALENSCPLDDEWKVQVLVLDCTTNPQSCLVRFAIGIKVDLQAYSPESNPTCLFVSAAELLDALDGTEYCPVGPWDIYWALPGYPSVFGPFARRHDESETTQINASACVFRDIPVTGSEDALRLMVVFKHPTDDTRFISALMPEIIPTDCTNQITSYEGLGAVKQEEDVKPAGLRKGGKATAAETQSKNLEMEMWLIQYFTGGNPPLRPFVAELRNTTAKAKEGGTVAQTYRWIQEIAELRVDFRRANMIGVPLHLAGRRISDGNWVNVLGRGTTYLTQARETLDYIKTCRHEEDVKKWLGDEKTTVALGKMIETIKGMAWNSPVRRQ